MDYFGNCKSRTFSHLRCKKQVFDAESDRFGVLSTLPEALIINSSGVVKTGF